MERELIYCKRLAILLKIPKKTRTDEENNDVIDILNRFQLFEMFSDNNKSNEFTSYCSNHVIIETYPENSVIYSIYDKPDKIFILLSGTVMLNSQESKVENEEINISHQGVNDLSLNTDEIQKEIEISPVELNKNVEKTEKNRLKSDFLRKNTKIIKNAEIFGDEYVENKLKREYTARTKEYSEVAVIKVKRIKLVISKIKEKKLNEIKEFLHNLNQFSSLSKTTISKIAHYFTLENISKNQYLYKEGEIPKYVYFIKSGEFTIFQPLTLELSQEPSIAKGVTFSEISTISRINKKYKKKKVAAAIKGENEIIGSDEVVQNLAVRTHSCMSNSEFAQVLKVSKENFLNKIMYPEAISNMKKTLKFNNE